MRELRQDRGTDARVTGLARNGYRFNVAGVTEEELEATGFITVDDDMLTFHLDDRMGWPDQVEGNLPDRGDVDLGYDPPNGTYTDYDNDLYFTREIADLRGITGISFEKRSAETVILTALADRYAQSRTWGEVRAKQIFPWQKGIRLDVSGLSR